MPQHKLPNKLGIPKKKPQTEWKTHTTGISMINLISVVSGNCIKHPETLKWSRRSQNIFKQDSPPAWTQEAYRPPCSKYSLCCPNWVPPPRPGYPPSQGTPPGYPPGQGTPPSWTWQGTPPPRLPHDILGNVAKHCGIWVPPPLWTDRLMDRHVSKHYLPVVLRTRAVKMLEIECPTGAMMGGWGEW